MEKGADERLPPLALVLVHSGSQVCDLFFQGDNSLFHFTLLHDVLPWMLSFNQRDPSAAIT